VNPWGSRRCPHGVLGGTDWLTRRSRDGQVSPGAGNVSPVIMMREILGAELRQRRLAQGRTLRDVSAAASVSLGYLSEVERGEKEASSELLLSICGALDLPLSQLLAALAARVAELEPAPISIAA
jgi:hypothetical protein